MYYVYVIYNKDSNKFYIGQTIDLKYRLHIHNNRLFRGSYTSRFNGIWRLIYKEEFSSRTNAIKRERQLKSYQGRRFIKNISRP